ncbi:MAG: hypothetical protein HOV83_23045 [Catenulispora sp.]|nr:hypothetical protein [Catenulispora sp.]
MPTRTGLRAGSAASLALIAVLGLTVSVSAASRQADLRHAVSTAEPLAVAAEDIYRDLSDADAASAETFLSAAQAGTAGQERFTADLNRVAANLAAVDADTRGSDALRAADNELLTGLPVFTKLIGTALADARQNLPVGAAYLREASALLRDRLLPAAQQALKVESDRLKADDDDAGAGYALEIGVIVATLVVLVVTQSFVRRRTQRMLNPGLVAATALVAITGVWTVVAGQAERDAVSRAKAHWQAADAAIATDLAAVQAHGDELLGLAARGEDVGGYERDFAAATARLDALLKQDHGAYADDARQARQSWAQAHSALIPAETEPQGDSAAIIKALQLLTQPVPGGSDAAFVRVDQDLRQGAEAEKAGYLAKVRAGHGDLAGLDVGAAVLMTAAVVLAGYGLDRRLREYR